MEVRHLPDPCSKAARKVNTEFNKLNRSVEVENGTFVSIGGKLLPFTETLSELGVKFNTSKPKNPHCKAPTAICDCPPSTRALITTPEGRTAHMEAKHACFSCAKCGYLMRTPKEITEHYYEDHRVTLAKDKCPYCVAGKFEGVE